MLISEVGQERVLLGEAQSVGRGEPQEGDVHAEGREGHAALVRLRGDEREFLRGEARPAAKREEVDVEPRQKLRGVLARGRRRVIIR